MDNYYFLDRERDAAEWDHCWGTLTDQTGGDTAEANPENGECWQYMGSVRRVTALGYVYWVHELRHRWRDVGLRDLDGEQRYDRVYSYVMATPAFVRAREGRLIEMGWLAWHARQKPFWSRMQEYGPAIDARA